MFVVLVVESVPEHLRGYLERFVQEVRTSVFVGTLSRRVIDDLWTTTCQNAGDGDVAMVIPTDNEAGFEIKAREHSRWRMIDHAGWMLSATRAPPSA